MKHTPVTNNLQHSRKVASRERAQGLSQLGVQGKPRHFGNTTIGGGATVRIGAVGSNYGTGSVGDVEGQTGPNAVVVGGEAGN